MHCNDICHFFSKLCHQISPSKTTFHLVIFSIQSSYIYIFSLIHRSPAYRSPINQFGKWFHSHLITFNLRGSLLLPLKIEFVQNLSTEFIVSTTLVVVNTRSRECSIYRRRRAEEGPSKCGQIRSSSSLKN